MILWTIQTLAAWEVLEKEKVLCNEPQFSQHSFLNAYQWMVVQMEARIEPRPAHVTCPLWAWYRWGGMDRPRPDLRSRGHLPPGAQGVRMEFEIADDQVLLSDFDLWHYVLNYWYLAESLEADERFAAELATHNMSYFETKPVPSEKYHRRIEQSWTKIFDLDWEEEDITYTQEEKKIQATFWQLHLSQVRDVTFFTAR